MKKLFILLFSSVYIFMNASLVMADEQKSKPAKKSFIPEQVSNNPIKNVPSDPEKISDKDNNSILDQIAKCWHPPAGVRKEHQNLTVVIDVEYNPDGSYKNVEISKKSIEMYNSNSLFHEVAESALRAVYECSPLKNLPPEKYNTWKTMELYFDPRELLL